MPAVTTPVNIARCPKHGLHGQRSTCYACGDHVEQVPMVPVADVRDWVAEMRDQVATRRATNAPGFEEEFKQGIERALDLLDGWLQGVSGLELYDGATIDRSLIGPTWDEVRPLYEALKATQQHAAKSGLGQLTQANTEVVLAAFSAPKEWER
jgi:hypothetical protein